jgi:hypothetical protein
MTLPAPVPAPVPKHGETPRSSSSGGFTVAELLVALALTSLIVLISLQLIVEAVGLVRRSERRLDPNRIVTVMANLRQDIHGSVAIDGIDIGWQSGPLDLAGWNGGRVRYLLEGDRVIRESRDSLGATLGRRVVAGGVIAWWWRPLDLETLEVRVTVGPDHPAARAGESRHTETRCFAVRGWPDGRSW